MVDVVAAAGLVLTFVDEVVAVAVFVVLDFTVVAAVVAVAAVFAVADVVAVAVDVLL